jgi:hypothetical protein
LNPAAEKEGVQYSEQQIRSRINKFALELRPAVFRSQRVGDDAAGVTAACSLYRSKEVRFLFIFIDSNKNGCLPLRSIPFFI